MIKVDHLYKSYGEIQAVKDLSFEIDEGHVYGFLGPNGAGKSTTMNIIAGCLSASSGHVSIGGFDIFDAPLQAKKLIGYLPEHPPLYVNETAEEYLGFVAQAKGIKGSDAVEQIEKVKSLTGISEVSNRLISQLSKGYKQRVGIAQALLGDPKVIILDEPTVGLDPVQIIEIRSLINDLGKDHTVIFSSHILSEVQAICDKVIIISKGRLTAFTDTDKINLLQSGTHCNVSVTVKSQAECIGAVIAKLSEEVSDWGWTPDGDGYMRVNIESNASDVREFCSKVFTAFAKADIPLCELTSRYADLEDVFLELVEETGGTEDDSSI